MREISRQVKNDLLEKLPQQQEEYELFIDNVKLHCKLDRLQQQIMIDDFNKALSWYLTNGFSLRQAFDLLDPIQLGGFYVHPAISWFPLDNAAIVYPLSMKFGQIPTFRMSVYLKEEVVPEILQMALTFTIKRFPSFATTVKVGFFWHYLNSSKRVYKIEEERILPNIPFVVSGSRAQSFKVYYYHNRISCEFFHVLTDGSGALIFLNTLMATYLKLMGKEISYDETVWNVEGLPQTDELINEFNNAEVKQGIKGFFGKAATQMSGKISDIKPCQVLHFELESKKLHDVAKSYDVKVSAYLLGQIFLASKYATEAQTGEIKIQVPVNMRKFNGSKTIRNYSMYFSCDLPIEKINSLEEILPNIARQVEEKSSYEEMSNMMSTTIKAVQLLRLVPIIIKRPVMKIVYGYLDGNLFSSYFSNIGVVKVPKGMEQYIDKFDFVLGPEGMCRASCGVVTYGSKTILSITKMTSDPSFEERLYKLLENDGLKPDVSGSGLYEG